MIIICLHAILWFQMSLININDYNTQLFGPKYLFVFSNTNNNNNRIWPYKQMIYAQPSTYPRKWYI